MVALAEIIYCRFVVRERKALNGIYRVPQYICQSSHGRIRHTIAAFSPPQASTLVRSHDHLRILLHQLLLGFFPPLILILLFIRRPLFRVSRLLSILPVFSAILQDNHNLLPTASNAPDPLLPHTRPTPLRPLHLIDPLRLPCPLIHVSICLQPLKELSAVPRRKVRGISLFIHGF